MVLVWQWCHNPTTLQPHNLATPLELTGFSDMDLKSLEVFACALPLCSVALSPPVLGAPTLESVTALNSRSIRVQWQVSDGHVTGHVTCSVATSSLRSYNTSDITHYHVILIAQVHCSPAAIWMYI